MKDGNHVPSLHQLCGKVGNNSLGDEIRLSVVDYLESKKDEAEPHASKVVRTTTKMELREDDNNIELPSNYTKRGMYVDWCYGRGFKAKIKNAATGSYGKLSEYAKRDDELWIPECKPVCSWNMFKHIWESDFPELIIKKSSHDTCGTCFRFNNLLNGLRRREIQAGKDNLRDERLQLGQFNDDGLPVDGLIEDQIHHPSLLSNESLSQKGSNPVI